MRVGQYLSVIIVVLLGLGPQALAAPLSCVETEERHAHRLGPRVIFNESDWPRQLVMPAEVVEHMEVYGDNNYREVLPNGWVAVLLRQPFGWAFRLFDKPLGPGRVDMSSVTPPFHGPNTRDLFGWHFRNAENTGPNIGDVNAPQALRPFEFSQALIGTAGIKPPRQDTALPYVEQDNEGRGWIQVIDLGLADLGPGQRARMNYLKAEGCLTWPRSEQERSDYLYQTRLDYVDEETEIMARCGLDLARHELMARVAPRQLGADFDGDGSHDDVVQIRDRTTGQHDVGICRAGTWHTRLGTISDDASFLHTLSALERWQIVPRDLASAGAPGGEDGWPAAEGDVLVLERVEKSMYLVYFASGKFNVATVFGSLQLGALNAEQ